MLLTGKIIQRIFKESNIVQKYPELGKLGVEISQVPKHGCGTCSIPDHLKRKLYEMLARDRNILEEFKVYYKTKIIELYFSIDGKRKELYYLK